MIPALAILIIVPCDAPFKFITLIKQMKKMNAELKKWLSDYESGKQV